MWRRFLSLCEGTPRLVVTDLDKALRKPLGEVFPRAGSGRRSGAWASCTCAAASRTRSPRSTRSPATLSCAPSATPLFDCRNWVRFETEARRSHQQQDPPLPALARWLDNYAELVAAQIETRSSLGPNSIGAVEAALRQVYRAFQGRSQGFGNLARLDLLLDLMTLHANGQPNPRRWADRLRERLHPRGGVPSQQRPHDDPRGYSSLLA